MHRKYIGHGVRNIYLYWILFFSLHFMYDFQRDISWLILGFFIYVVGYAGVYFLNDFADNDEDSKKHRKSLYLDIKNKKIFWTLCCSCIAFGAIGSLYISLHAFFLFITLYILNVSYSFSPLKLRNVTLGRELNFFILYFLKWIYLMYAVGFYPYNPDFPLVLIIAMSSFATIGVFVYKGEVRNIFHHRLAFASCFLFLSILTISTIASAYLYPKMQLLLLPILPATAILFYFYRERTLPLLTLQTAFFVYMLFVYLLS